MTTAKLRIAAWTLALGLMAPAAAWATPLRAEAPRSADDAERAPVVQLADGVSSSLSHTKQAASSPNIHLDPRSGREIYTPTGETIDQVIEVVASKVPVAVASLKHQDPTGLGLGLWALGTGLSALAHLGMLAFGLVLFALGAKRWLKARESLMEAPLKALGTGALTVAAVFTATVLLALTFIGIPLALMVGFVGWLGLYVGQLVAALSLGALLPESLRPRSDLGQVAAGAVALWSISLVPGIGLITSIAASLLGLGACFMARARDSSPVLPGTSLSV
jgi:hypothetical protein